MMMMVYNDDGCDDRDDRDDYKDDDGSDDDDSDTDYCAAATDYDDELNDLSVSTQKNLTEGERLRNNFHEPPAGNGRAPLSYLS